MIDATTSESATFIWQPYVSIYKSGVFDKFSDILAKKFVLTHKNNYFCAKLQKILEDTSFFESLLTWGAVILYFGAMIYKSVKGNDKNVEQQKPVRSVRCVEPQEIVPVAPKVSEVTPYYSDQSPKVSVEAEETQSIDTLQTKPTTSSASRQFTAKQRRLRNAIIWSEILKPKYH